MVEAPVDIRPVLSNPAFIGSSPSLRVSRTIQDFCQPPLSGLFCVLSHLQGSVFSELLKNDASD
ncbi:MAG: hypothetical protein HGA58_01300 [Chlorobiaceae bacterium]|jgi:hypothetical protein|nr:hypothetical protein [Chlorobiaceae bacterium]